MFPVERKDKVIHAMEANYKEIKEAIRDEIEKITKGETWSGPDYKANRLISALNKIDVSSGQHRIIHYLREQGGGSTKAEIIRDLVGPKPGMLWVSDFEKEKQGFNLELDKLQQKGIISVADKGNIKLHPWVEASISYKEKHKNTA